MRIPRRCRSREGLAAWAYLEAHACELRDEPLTLRESSRELGISESTIQRALDEEFGLSFGALRDLIRVEQALSLLSDESDVKTSALALAAGWRSRTNLYSAIRRVTHCDLSSLRANDSLLQEVLMRLTRAIMALPGGAVSTRGAA